MSVGPRRVGVVLRARPRSRTGTSRRTRRPERRASTWFRQAGLCSPRESNPHVPKDPASSTRSVYLFRQVSLLCSGRRRRRGSNSHARRAFRLRNGCRRLPSAGSSSGAPSRTRTCDAMKATELQPAALATVRPTHVSAVELCFRPEMQKGRPCEAVPRLERPLLSGTRGRDLRQERLRGDQQRAAKEGSAQRTVREVADRGAGAPMGRHAGNRRRNDQASANDFLSRRREVSAAAREARPCATASCRRPRPSGAGRRSSSWRRGTALPEGGTWSTPA